MTEFTQETIASVKLFKYTNTSVGLINTFLFKFNVVCRFLNLLALIVPFCTLPCSPEG